MKTTVLKTNMREAFENVLMSGGNHKTCLMVMKSLQKGIGVIHRKRMWAVLRG